MTFDSVKYTLLSHIPLVYYAWQENLRFIDPRYRLPRFVSYPLPYSNGTLRKDKEKKNHEKVKKNITFSVVVKAEEKNHHPHTNANAVSNTITLDYAFLSFVFESFFLQQNVNANA